MSRSRPSAVFASLLAALAVVTLAVSGPAAAQYRGFGKNKVQPQWT